MRASKISYAIFVKLFTIQMLKVCFSKSGIGKVETIKHNFIVISIDQILMSNYYFGVLLILSCQQSILTNNVDIQVGHFKLAIKV